MARLPASPTCDEFARQLPSFVDRELPARQRAVLEDHLDHCLPCRAAFRAEGEWLDRIRRRLRSAPIPRAVLDRLARAVAAGRLEAPG